MRSEIGIELVGFPSLAPSFLVEDSFTVDLLASTDRGVIPGGAGGGGCGPPNFWPTTLFSGFSHTTDTKVPSEVVLMGAQSYMVMSLFFS